MASASIVANDLPGLPDRELLSPGYDAWPRASALVAVEVLHIIEVNEPRLEPPHRTLVYIRGGVSQSIGWRRITMLGIIHQVIGPASLKNCPVGPC